MRRAARALACATALALPSSWKCSVGLAADAGDLPIAVRQSFRAYANGRVLYEHEGIVLVSTILGKCRVQVWKDSHDDEARIAERSQPLGFTIVRPSTKARWSRALEREFITLAARTPFRVLGVVSYRCFLPHMAVMSADDAGLNQNETGEDGTYYRVRVLRGAARGKTALWNPDYDSIDADTGRPCFATVSTTASCDLGW